MTKETQQKPQEGTAESMSQAAEDLHKNTGGGKPAPNAEKDIANRFTYHLPKPGQPEKYEGLRAMAKQLAIAIARQTPFSREQSLALTSLEESIFWANAAIARNS